MAFYGEYSEGMGIESELTHRFESLTYCFQGGSLCFCLDELVVIRLFEGPHLGAAVSDCRHIDCLCGSRSLQSCECIPQPCLLVSTDNKLGISALEYVAPCAIP